MAESCSIYPQCRNSKGEVVDSRLFKDLLEYSNNDRVFAKKMYAVALNQDFLSRVEDDAVFDENGEITMRSLLELTKTSINNERMIAKLNKDIQEGDYEWNDAIQKVQSFNRDSQWNNKYMATLSDSANNQYHVSIVPRNAANESALSTTIANQTIQNRIISILAKHGVAVDFLKEGRDRYSTENAQQTADGLYHLIEIVQGKKDVTDAVAEEAGHFTVAALGNSPLVQRLTKLLTPEVQKEILGEEYESKYLGRDAAREVAGDLVGQALIGHMNSSSWGRLAVRIADLARKIFYTLKGDTVAQARLEAQQIADDIAKGFISDKFQGSVEEALKTQETLYQTQYSPNVKAYRQVTAHLATAVNELKAMNSTLTNKLQSIMTVASLDRESRIAQNIGALSDQAALEGIAETMDLLLDMMSVEIPELLNSVDFNNTLDFATNMARNGKSLREAHIVTQKCLVISDIIAEMIGRYTDERLTSFETIQYLDPATGKLVTKNLKELQQQLSKFIAHGVTDGFYDQLMQKEKQFFCKFLEDSYGSKYVTRAARVLFKFKNIKDRNAHVAQFINEQTYSIRDLVDNLETDTSFFDRWFASMANSGDIIGEIVDKVTKQANKQADNMTNRIWDALKALEEQMKTVLNVKDPVKFYERDKQGNLTGYIISNKLWGVWEQEYNDFMAEKKKEFMEERKDNLDFQTKSEGEKALLWQMFFDPLRKEWHNRHSKFNSEQGRWEPNDSDQYHNDEFDNLTTAERQWLGEIMEIKQQLDQLVEGSMPTHRAPQFKGTFMNRIRNRGSRLNPKLYAKGMWEHIKEGVVLDVEDAGEFGSAATYNAPEEDMFGNQLAFEKEKLNRLPMFGINKLKDMTALSTDIFHSMLAYASMATHYAAMNQVVDTIEVGREVLKNRKVEGIKSETERKEGFSRAYTRYLKFLDKQVYGVSTPPLVIKGIVINKIANSLSSFASKLFLGGNVAGGLVNLGTGVNELFKEAMSGEHYNVADWTYATGYYFKHLPFVVLETGKSMPDDELSLIMRHFNMLGDNKEAQKSYSTYHSRAANFIFGEALLLPYTSGEHYMQSMSYLALMHNIKVYDEEGKEHRLLDMYRKKAISYTDIMGNTRTYKKAGSTIELDKVFFKSMEDRDNYFMAKSIIDAISNAPSSGVFGPVVTLTEEQQAYLDAKGWSLANLDSTLGLLQKELRSLVWNTDDESTLMDKAREINDRLHGIYNDQDKTALHQNILGNMLLAMRGYALGMIQRRFGNDKFNVALNRDVEGSLVTFAKLWAACFTDRWGVLDTAAAILFAPSKKVKAKMEAAGFSSSQYYNIRRNFGDMLVITILMLLKALTAKKDDDDETEEDMKQILAMMKQAGYSKEQIEAVKADFEKKEQIDPIGVLYYYSARVLREQAAFNLGTAMVDEFEQITSLVPAGVSAVLSMGSLVSNMYGDLMYDYEELDPAYYEMLKQAGYSKEQIAEIRAADKKALMEGPGRKYFYQSNGPDGIYKKGDPKWKRKAANMTPYYRTRNVLYHPYEAEKAFEYGRQVKTR